jgi:hypothetical protein
MSKDESLITRQRERERDIEKWGVFFIRYTRRASHYEHAPGKLQRRDERGDWTSGLRIQMCKQDKSIEAPWLQGGAGVAAAARFDMSIAGAGNLGWLPLGGVEGKGKVGERESWSCCGRSRASDSESGGRWRVDTSSGSGATFLQAATD